MIDGKLLLDAGAVTSVPRLSEQCRISNILVTHTHLDHIKDIPFLPANLGGDRFYQPLNIISIPRAIEGIKAYLFDDALRPDLAAPPTVKSSVLKSMSMAIPAAGNGRIKNRT